MPLIQVKGLVKHFQITKRDKGITGAIKSLFKPNKEIIKALDGLTFTIEKGDILGYVGPNGAGKSTTIKVLTGILTPTSGEALVDGKKPYENRQENAKKVGFVFGQRSRLWWLLPAYDSLEYTRVIYSVPDNIYYENLEYCKRKLDLEPLLGKPVRSLSLGQRMRIELAVAMIHNPSILYLDEPTIGLDIVGKNELRDMIKTINRDRGVTVILATHDVSDIEMLSSRVMIIDKGKTVWQGNLNELRRAKGDKRMVTVQFNSPVAQVQIKGFKPIQIENLKHIYEVDIQQVGISEIMEKLFSAGEIADINISETRIEDVIHKIYKEGTSS